MIYIERGTDTMGAKKTKEPTPVEKKRLQEFNRLREEFMGKGYREEVISISALKANVVVLAAAIPVVAALSMLYYWMHPNIGVGSNITSIETLFILAIVVSIAVHELIHGIAWSLYCKNRWNSIAFGVIWKYLTPYCTCGECLPFKGYFLGVLMPTIILGLLPYTVALVVGYYPLMLFGVTMILCGGGDLYLLWLIRGMKDAVLIDHPTSIGCVAFTKISADAV